MTNSQLLNSCCEQVFVPEAETFVSCCVTVTNLERNVFVIPRTTRVTSSGDETV